MTSSLPPRILAAHNARSHRRADPLTSSALWTCPICLFSMDVDWVEKVFSPKTLEMILRNTLKSTCVKQGLNEIT
jgi:hypothetical protein